VAALVAAILHGASIVRVHSVRPAVEAALVADAVLASEMIGTTHSYRGKALVVETKL